MPRGPERQGRRDRLGERADPHLLEVEAARTSRPRTSTSSPGKPAEPGARRHARRSRRSLDATAKPSDQLGKEVEHGWQKLVNDGGLTLFHDWSSPTMLETIGQTFQELLAGRTSPEDVVTRIQKDWEDYDSELKSGS